MPNKSAERILQRFWAGQLYPVDPIAIAKKMGLQVFNAALPNDVAGAIMKKPGEPASIFLNQSDTRQRRRFTCAHELGHYVDIIERNQVVDSYQIIEHRTNFSTEDCMPNEHFANHFAAYLLMPDQELSLKRHNSVWQLAEYFDVSPETMLVRMKQIGLTAADHQYA